jgi:L-serine dehydratase
MNKKPASIFNAVIGPVMRGPSSSHTAASMALQNVMGMVCDPVGDRVEVPCLGKNVMAGFNAIACANMALAGFDKVIPLDETIDSMYKVGQMLPHELRCTGKGGLSVTPTGIKIFEELNG